MGLTQEDIVTQILSKNEIIHIDRTQDLKSDKFPLNPNYDLNEFLKLSELEQKCFRGKYIFVK